jgi:hypothetical protein
MSQIYVLLLSNIFFLGSAFTCRRLKPGHSILFGEHCEHDNGTKDKYSYRPPAGTSSE